MLIIMQSQRYVKELINFIVFLIMNSTRGAFYFLFFLLFFNSTTMSNDIIINELGQNFANNIIQKLRQDKLPKYSTIAVLMFLDFEQEKGTNQSRLGVHLSSKVAEHLIVDLKNDKILKRYCYTILTPDNPSDLSLETLRKISDLPSTEEEESKIYRKYFQQTSPDYFISANYYVGKNYSTLAILSAFIRNNPFKSGTTNFYSNITQIEKEIPEQYREDIMNLHGVEKIEDFDFEKLKKIRIKTFPFAKIEIDNKHIYDYTNYSNTDFFHYFLLGIPYKIEVSAKNKQKLDTVITIDKTISSEYTLHLILKDDYLKKMKLLRIKKNIWITASAATALTGIGFYISSRIHYDKYQNSTSVSEATNLHNKVKQQSNIAYTSIAFGLSVRLVAFIPINNYKDYKRNNHKEIWNQRNKF